MGTSYAAQLRMIRQTLGAECRVQRIRRTGPKGEAGQFVICRGAEVLAAGWTLSEAMYVATSIEAQKVMRELSKMKSAADTEDQRLAAAEAETALAAVAPPAEGGYAVVTDAEIVSE